MRDLEEKALTSLNLELPFYHRYVDDIVLAAPINKITDIVNTFNKQHNRLQFTSEMEVNRTLSFLDLLLRVDDGEIVIDWYHKETFSEGIYHIFRIILYVKR